MSQIHMYVNVRDASEGWKPTPESEEEKQWEGQESFSFDISTHSLKDCKQLYEDTGDFQLGYMDIMSYILYFYVFFKTRMEVMVGTLHL